MNALNNRSRELEHFMAKDATAHLDTEVDHGRSAPSYSRFAREAIEAKSRNPGRSVALFQACVGMRPNDARAWMHLLDLALAGHGPLSPADVVERFEALAKAEVGPHEVVLRALLTARQHALAARHAMSHPDLIERSLRFAQLALKAFERAGMTQDSLKTALHISQCTIDHPGALAEAGTVLLRNGMAEACLTMIVKNQTLQDGDVRVLRMRAEACSRIEGREAEALHVIRLAAIRAPKDPRIAELEADLLIQLGLCGQAIASLRRIPESEFGPTTRTRLARALEAAGCIDDAVAQLEEVVRLQPNSAHIRRKCVGLLARGGRKADASSLYQEGLRLRAGQLPRTAAEGMRDIAKNRPEPIIPAARLDWMERVLVAEGRPVPEGWRQEAHRHAHADALLLNWAECCPDRAGELPPLMHLPDETLATAAWAIASGKGVFVTSAHVGLLYTGPIALRTTNYKTAFVASVPDLGQPIVSQGLISASTNDTAAIGRQIIRALARNSIIAIAIDGMSAPGDAVRSLFGAKIRLSDFCARVSWKLGTPCLFPMITLECGRSVVRLERLPLAMSGEPEAAFVDRWLDAYISLLSSFLLTHPDAMRGSGGFWGSVTRV